MFGNGLFMHFKYIPFMATLGLHYIMQHYSDMVQIMYHELKVAKNNDMITLTCDQKYFQIKISLIPFKNCQTKLGSGVTGL